VQAEAISALERAGPPVIRIALRDVYDLGQEFFRWEIATAVAGSILGVNPFDQPDVEASKIETRKLTAEYESRGALPAEKPFLSDSPIQLFADERSAAAMFKPPGASPTLAACLRAHFARLTRGDYFAILAYLEMNSVNENSLQEIRRQVRDRFRVATCLGFGPRFLHSTGQAYKGGPNTGVFLQLTCDDSADVPVPGQKYTFGVVKAAQSRGDFEVLAARGRRALRAHLGSDVAGGLRALVAAVQEALR
jgi:transaldolase/glucose-6-phosphate isomerase